MTRRPISKHGVNDLSDTRTDYGTQTPQNETGVFSPSCVSLDLEVGKNNNRIYAFAALRSDTGRSVVFRGGDLRTNLLKLDDLAKPNQLQDALLGNASVILRESVELPDKSVELRNCFSRLGLSDVNLGFGGLKMPVTLCIVPFLLCLPEIRLECRLQMDAGNCLTGRGR